jgi:replication factor C large subunit
MLYASAIGKQRLDETQVHTSQKDERVSIFSLIAALAEETSDEDVLRLSREVEDTPETIEQWIEGNIHLLVGEPSIREAYRHLARADEYLGYTYRRQYHTLWRYANAVMLLGVADMAAGKGVHARIMPPARWQKMSDAKKQKAIRNALLNQVAEMMHIPQNSLREEYLGIFSLLVEHDPVTFTKELLMDTESLNFFLNDKAKSQAIVKSVALELKEQEKQKEKEPTVKKPPEIEPQEPEEPPRLKKMPTRNHPHRIRFPFLAVSRRSNTGEAQHRNQLSLLHPGNVQIQGDRPEGRHRYAAQGKSMAVSSRSRGGWHR